MTRRQPTERNQRADQMLFADLLPRARLHPAVLAWTETRAARGAWCIALSGGADSVALLLALTSLRPERRKQMVALHFNHRLRGRASDADERFCRQLCRKLEIACVIGHWADPPRGATEAASRAARHEFFSAQLQRHHGRALWLAHQRDDIAESQLMRLARGSGTAGLAAPRPVQSMADQTVHLRPLLTVAKSELAAVLRKYGQDWREDASNASDAHFRNRVRRQVVPAWRKAAGRDAEAGAALSRELLEEDDAALEAWVDRLHAVRRKALDVEACRGLPKAVVRRLLHRWMLAVRPQTDLSRQGFSLLLAAVQRGADTRFSLGNGLAILRGGNLTFRGNRL